MSSWWTSGPDLRAFWNGEEDDAGDDGADPGPERDIDRLLLFDREVERADLRLVGGFRVREVAVHQSDDAGDDQHEGDHFERCHDHNLRPGRPPLMRRTTK